MRSGTRAIVKALTPPIIMDAVSRLQRGVRRDGSFAMQIANSGASFDHREAIGGLWDEIGHLQLRYLVENGLEPHHKLLDVGCGALRGGVHFIRYLNDGNYYGIDISQKLIDAATLVELPLHGLAGRTVHLACRSDFDFSVFGVQFEYAIAQSVFTHIAWNSILRCLVNMGSVLQNSGEFYATFFDDPDGTHRTTSLRHDPGDVVTYPDRDPYHYEFDVFEELARRASLAVRRVGNWGHPRDQMMMVFARPGADE